MLPVRRSPTSERALLSATYAMPGSNARSKLTSTLQEIREHIKGRLGMLSSELEAGS
jgi:hypothetical protein